MSDTPETDARMAGMPEGCYCHPADAIELARRLESERDEAIELLYDMTCQHWCGCGHPACNRCGDDGFNAKFLKRFRKNGPWNAFGK